MSESMCGDPADFPMTEFYHGNETEHRLGLPNYWINTANLNLIIIDRISIYKGLGPAIRFALTYNDQSADSGQFGFGWSFSFESLLKEEGDLILLKKGSGQCLRFRSRRPHGSGSESSPVEAENLSKTGDRLLDYGTHWLFLAKGIRTSFSYKRSAGKKIIPLHSISDYDGNTITLDYSQEGTLQTITDAAGRISRFENSGRLCTRITLPDGKHSTFQYDTSGRLTTVSDFQGIPVRYEYNPAGLLIVMEVGEDRKRTTFHYDNSVLSAITDAAGFTTRYMQEGNTVRIVDPLGNTTTYSSHDGRTVKILNPVGESDIFEYAGGHRVGHTDGKTNGSRMAYDGAGNPTRYTSPNGEVTNFTYDRYGNISAEITPQGNTFSFTYDSRQHVTGARGPLGAEIRFNYDQKGQLVSVADQMNNTTTFSHDQHGNIVEITDPEGGRTRFSYDPSGLILREVTDARGNTSQYEFDGNRRLTRIIHADGTSVRHVYGCCSRLATIDENGIQTKYLRDPLLSVIERRVGDGDVFRYRYDPCRRLIQSVDPCGRTTDFVYDGAGRITRATYPNGEFTGFEYVSKRTPSRIVDENGHIISFLHDRNGALVQEIDQTGIPVSVTRDMLGRIGAITTARGRQITCEYDAEGHITGKQLDGKPAVSFSYDPAGNLVQMNDPSGTTTYRYNRVRKIIGISLPGNHDITCTYDEAGNMTSLRYPGGLQVTYQYDTRNRPTRAAFANHTIDIQYDNIGNILSETRSNGTRSTYRYNTHQRPTEVTHLKGPSAFAMAACIRDPAGNICEESSQPVPERVRPVPFTATYTPHNQVETWNGDRYRYDRDGNLSKIEGVRSFTGEYDAFNHLIDLQINGKHLRFLHNGRGQRVQRAGDGHSRRYVYGPTGDLISEADETGTVISSYVYCRGRLLARISGGRTYFYHADARGHIISLTDEQANVSASYAYDPFGKIVEETGIQSDQPFTYCGLYGVMREGRDLYFMKRRYYDSVTGRFIQKDPIGIIGGVNVYTYAGNNPVTYSDPEGLIAPVIAAGLILFAWAGAAVSMSQNRSYNTINNVLNGANEYIANPGAEGAFDRWMGKLSDIGNIPEAVMDDIFEGQRALWDKFLSLHPASWDTYWGEYGPANVYSGMKAAYDTVTGEWFDAARNWLETIPSWPGQLANGLNNWYDAYFGDENKCK